MPLSPALIPRDSVRERILIVSSWYPSARSGVSGMFVEDQAIVLGRQYDVQVYVPQFFSIRDLFPRGKLPPAGIERRQGVSVQRARTFMPPFCTRSMGTLRSAARRASRQLCKAIEGWGRPAVIHAHVAFPAGWIAAQAGAELGIPVVLTEHSGPFSALVAHAPQRPLVHEALVRAQQVVAVSPALAGQIEAEFPDVRPGVLGNVVRTDLFMPANSRPAQAGPTIAAVAILTKNKGLDILIEALARMSDAGAGSAQLVIAGDGPERQQLEQQARARGVEQRCRFAGMLDRAAVIELIRRCDVFVLPSRGETFGLVLAEAMACGKPVVATRCGGPEFFVTPQSGILVPVGDAEALAQALVAVIKGSWRVDAQASRQNIDARFGPETFLRNVAAVYENASGALSRGPARQAGR
jgi:L-malate glycosyltransferase